MYDHGFKDLSGQKFGEWTVLQLADPLVYKVNKKEFHRRRTHIKMTRWLCRCSCGRESIVIAQTLQNGRSISCGMCGSHRIKLEGSIYHGFDVKRFTGMDPKSHQATYECICLMCGKLCTMQQGKMSKQKSCGCARKKEPGRSGLNRLFSQYVRGAKNRMIEFKLTFEEFVAFTKMNCHYCNEPPNQISGDSRKFRGNAHANYTYTGIDRMDSNKGYTKNNCVPCCGECNTIKWDLTYDRFLFKVKQIHDFLIRSNP